LPAEGILIWHVDDNIGSIKDNNINSNPSHKRVDLEEQDKTPIGRTDFGDENRGDPGDVFSEPYQEFKAPQSNSYYEPYRTGIGITDFKWITTDYMTFDVWIKNYPGEEVTNKSESVLNVRAYPQPIDNISDNNKVYIKVKVGFKVAEDKVKVRIYNLAAEHIKTLSHEKVELKDEVKILIFSWNGENEAGYRVTSGIYLYAVSYNHDTKQLKTIKEEDDTGILTGKLLLMK
jgi:hypothetical protein